MSLFLRVTDDRPGPWVVRAESPSILLVGRRQDCDITLEEPAVSRQHCLLTVKDGWIVVEDMRSRNGTYLNNVVEILGPTAIGPGDWLKLGGARIEVLPDAGIDEAALQQCHSARSLIAYLPAQGGSRKLRLIACAWHRHILGPYQPVVQQLIELAEQMADGLVVPEDMQHEDHSTLASPAPHLPWCRWEQMLRLVKPSARAAIDTAFDLILDNFEMSDVQPVMNRLIRDVLGDVLAPFRPADEWLHWQRGTLRTMAQIMYNEGTFSELPILADALEDAGCTEARVLEHCRIPGPHVRGCWVLDGLMQLRDPSGAHSSSPLSYPTAERVG
jgi:hypothetical protein